MKINKKIYTYPIISSDKSDYKKSIFKTKLKCEEINLNELCIDLNIEMSNKELNELIETGKAEYVVHLECSNTSYRKIRKFNKRNIKYNITLSDIDEKLEIVVFIVVKSEVKGFKSDDWVEDFSGLSFDFEKGDILGYLNLGEIDNIKNIGELSNSDSILIIYKILDENKKYMEIEMDTRNDKIRIGLPTNEYDLYIKLCNNNNDDILNTMIIFPALIYIFEEMKQDEGIENYKDKDWFKSMEKKYKERGLDFIAEIDNEENTSIKLAQDVMEYPLIRALLKMTEENEEEDN